MIGKSVKDIIRHLFLSNLGEVITRENIDVALREVFGDMRIENWHQRLSELRVDEGYTILSNRDRVGLRVGEYLMPNAERRPNAGRRTHPSATTWEAVLLRAGGRCEWNSDGMCCELMEGDIDPTGGGTVRLTPDHVQPHSLDPVSDPDDPNQWNALCARHQVTKKNYWCGDGKLNVTGIVQAASRAEKAEVFQMLTCFFNGCSDIHIPTGS